MIESIIFLKDVVDNIDFVDEACLDYDDYYDDCVILRIQIKKDFLKKFKKEFDKYIKINLEST